MVHLLSRPTIDQEVLFNTALPEAIAAFQAAVDKYPTEHFYGYCFFVGPTLNCVMPHANTVEGLKRIWSEDEPEERPYYQWSSVEWDIEFGQRPTNVLMRNTNSMLFAAYDEDNEDYAGQAKQDRETLTTLAKVLLEVRNAGIFNGSGENKRPAFWIDSYEPFPMLEQPNYFVGPYLDPVDHAEILRSLDIPPLD